MNASIMISRPQVLRRLFPVVVTLVLVAMTSRGEMQPLVPGNYVTSLNWSEDGSLLAYGTGQIIPPWGEYDSDGGMARVVERNGTIVFALDFPYPVGNVEVSPTESLVLVGPFREVFELATQQLVVGPGGGIAFIDGVWHPTSDLLLLTEVLGARTYDPVTQDSLSILGRAEIPINSPDDGRTVTSVWSPDGLFAATSTTLGPIYIWDTTREVSAVQATFSGHTRSVQHIVWNATTNLIASGDDSGRILVWNPNTGETIQEFTGHTDAILDIDWRTDGAQLVSTSLDNTMRVWDWTSGDMRIIESGRLISAIAYNPDGTELAYGGEIADPDDIHIEIVPVQSLNEPTPTPTDTPTDTPTPTATFTDTPTPTSTPDGVVCTATISAGDTAGLISAIHAANSSASTADTICLTSGSTYTVSAAVSGSNGLPAITSAITIVGRGATIQRSSGAPQFRLFSAAANGSLTLINVTLSGGSAGSENGGAVLNQGSFTMENSALSGNSGHYGGGIYSVGALTVRDSILSGNTATERGGAVYAVGSFSLSDTLLENNQAPSGGAVYLNSGAAMLTAVTLRQNSATQQGGGLYMGSGALAVYGSRFEQNQAQAGAALSNGGTLTVSGSVFSANVAQQNGGGIYNRTAGAQMVQNSCFSGNAGTLGGGIYSVTAGFVAWNNWWGAPSGPSGSGTGSGDAVNANIMFAPFLTTGCPNG